MKIYTTQAYETISVLLLCHINQLRSNCNQVEALVLKQSRLSGDEVRFVQVLWA